MKWTNQYSMYLIYLPLAGLLIVPMMFAAVAVEPEAMAVANAGIGLHLTIPEPTKDATVESRIAAVELVKQHALKQEYQSRHEQFAFSGDLSKMESGEPDAAESATTIRELPARQASHPVETAARTISVRSTRPVAPTVERSEPIREEPIAQTSQSPAVEPARDFKREAEQRKKAAQRRVEALFAENGETPPAVENIEPTPEQEPAAGTTVTRKEGRRVRNGNSFFSSGEETASAAGGNTIRAVIHEDQEVLGGSTVKLRILEEITVAGTRVPPNSFVYGKAAIQADRVHIEITGIRIDNHIYPFKRKVLDRDGIVGIYIPNVGAGEDERAVGANVASQALRVGAVGTGIAGQIASTMVGGAQSMIRKRAAVNKVLLKANHQLFIQ